MKSFKNAEVKYKILFGYAVMILCCVAVALISFTQLGRNSGPGMLIVVLDVLGIIFALWYGKKVAKAITEPIVKAKYALEELSCGHLDVRTQNESEDEIGQMSRVLDNFIFKY